MNNALNQTKEVRQNAPLNWHVLKHFIVPGAER